MSANAVRGEASVVLLGTSYVVRPSFAALVAAEAEVGPLFQLAETAVAGALSVQACEALLWHCLAPAPMERAAFREALLAAGLASLMPAVRVILVQILAGR